MLRRQLSLVFVFLSTPLVFFACGGGERCPTRNVSYFKINTVQPVTTEADGVTRIAHLTPYPEPYKTEVIETAKKLRVSFFQHAYAATKCPPDAFTQSILGIDVVSSNDFNAAHPAGTLLNGFITVKQYGVVTHPPIPHQELSEIFPANNLVVGGYAIDFYLKELPTVSSLQKFIVTIYLDDGSMYEVETDWIDFNLI